MDKHSQCDNTRRLDKRANRAGVANMLMFPSDNRKLLEATKTFDRANIPLSERHGKRNQSYLNHFPEDF